MKPRKIAPIKYRVDTSEITAPLAELETQVTTGKYRYLLAYADDGVIWGTIRSGKLELSGSAFPDISPALREETLCELRVFGENAEWHLWRFENKWLARKVTETEGTDGEAYDEEYILWGTDSAQDPENGFSPVREADLGIIHAPPVKFNGRHSLKVLTRHYLDHDEAGVVYVKLSRLVHVESGGE